MSIQSATEINPARVRYIKLGEKGRWEEGCINKGIIRFGFESASAERFPLCRAGKWDGLTQSFLAAGKDKGTATRHTNETQLFFEDDGTTLWITFVGERLYWALLTADPPERHADGDGVWRKVNGNWQWHDISGKPLTKDRLSGALTKLGGFRGTSCDVDVADYVVRRINGHKTPQVERAVAALENIRHSVQELMQLLEPRDFELLVELVFAHSGWQRLGRTGGTQKTIDLDLELPSTGERAFIQVKSRTTSAQLADYINRLEAAGPYDRMFFVHHSEGEIGDNDRKDVTVIGPEQLAKMIVDAGLVSWLIRKVS